MRDTNYTNVHERFDGDCQANLCQFVKFVSKPDVLI